MSDPTWPSLNQVIEQLRSILCWGHKGWEPTEFYPGVDLLTSRARGFLIGRYDSCQMSTLDANNYNNKIKLLVIPIRNNNRQTYHTRKDVIKDNKRVFKQGEKIKVLGARFPTSGTTRETSQQVSAQRDLLPNCISLPKAEVLRRARLSAFWGLPVPIVGKAFTCSSPRVPPVPYSFGKSEMESSLFFLSLWVVHTSILTLSVTDYFYFW